MLKFGLVSLALFTSAIASDDGPLKVVIINPLFLSWLQMLTSQLATRIH